MSETIQIPDLIQIADRHIEGGYGCGQAVLAAFSAGYGMTEKQARAIASCFGGGVGRSGQVCGAVSGSLMVLGMYLWDDEAEVASTKERIYALSGEFLDRFAALHGTTQCRELLGYNLRDPVQLEKAKEDGVFSTQCPGYIRDAIQLLVAFIHEIEQRDSQGD
jgi:C_GCAxxG_C_C family probable redox protein